ncbi:MAG: DUF3313 domain-containing protein [Candidatus Binatia bacterium]
MLTAAAIALAAWGCGGRIQHSPAIPTPAPVLRPIESGFLSDYSKLQVSEQFADVRLSPVDSRKGGYRKILFRPVAVWRGADRRLEDVTEEDLQYLADSLYQAMVGRLGQSFEMVREPAADVLEIHLAFTLITDPDSSIDFFTTTVPVKDLARRHGPLADATRRFVRNCALEAEFLEARPPAKKGGKPVKTVRAALFDTRRGADTPKGRVETWEDVEAVFADGAKLLDQRLESLRDGTFKPRLTVPQRQ